MFHQQPNQADPCLISIRPILLVILCTMLAKPTVLFKMCQSFTPSPCRRWGQPGPRITVTLTLPLPTQALDSCPLASLPCRKEGHSAETGAPGPLRLAAYFWWHAPHPEPRGAEGDRRNSSGRGQAGSAVWDHWSQEPGSQPDPPGLCL